MSRQVDAGISSSRRKCVLLKTNPVRGAKLAETDPDSQMHQARLRINVVYPPILVVFFVSTFPRPQQAGRVPTDLFLLAIKLLV